MAEPLGGHESLLGIVFRRQECDRRLVPVHASESDDAVGYLYHPLSDTLRGGNCNVSRLTNPTKPSLLSKPVIELVFFRSLLVLLCYKLNTFC